MFKGIKDPKHPLHLCILLMCLLKCLVVKWLHGPHTHTKLPDPLSCYGRVFIPHSIREVLDCFRLGLLLLVSLLVVLVLLLLVNVYFFSNFLIDYGSNIIRVVWYFVMLYIVVLYHFNLKRLNCNKYSTSCIVYYVFESPVHPSVRYPLTPVSHDAISL